MENRREEQAPIRVRQWRSKLCELVPISQVQHQCGCFVERLAVRGDQHWHQASWVYGQEFRRPVLAILDVYFSEFVLYLAFLEHPLDERCAGEVTSIENVHQALPS